VEEGLEGRAAAVVALGRHGRLLTESSVRAAGCSACGIGRSVAAG
jgi:hypothetical protein